MVLWHVHRLAPRFIKPDVAGERERPSLPWALRLRLLWPSMPHRCGYPELVLLWALRGHVDQVLHVRYFACLQESMCVYMSKDVWLSIISRVLFVWRGRLKFVWIRYGRPIPLVSMSDCFSPSVQKIYRMPLSQNWPNNVPCQSYCMSKL